MTQRTFWTIVIKIFGIFLILESVSVIPQGIASLSYVGFTEEDSSYISLFVGIAILLAFLVILKLFVYNPGWLIDKLKLDKGFPEETINININKESVISIASIILGGVLVVDGLPVFCKQLFVFYQEEAMSGRFGDKPSFQWLIFHGIKVLVGYLVVTNHKVFARYVDKKSETPE